MHYMRYDSIRTWWVSKLSRYVFTVIFHFCIHYYNAGSQSAGHTEKRLQPIQHLINHPMRSALVPTRVTRCRNHRGSAAWKPRVMHTTRRILLHIAHLCNINNTLIIVIQCLTRIRQLSTNDDKTVFSLQHHDARKRLVWSLMRSEIMWSGLTIDL